MCIGHSRDVDKGLKRIYEMSQVTGMGMINAVGGDELCLFVLDPKFPAILLYKSPVWL